MEEIIYSAKNRPQRLCKQCGKCCTMAVCKYSKEELEEFSACQESEAGDFLDAFIPYENLDEPSKISQEYVDVMVNKLKEQDKYKEGENIFYHCKYINPDNTCSIYENRYGWCKRTPNHGWTLMPSGCGFEGWQFALREQIKHNVRKIKEYIYECEVLYGEGEIPSKKITVKELKEIAMQRILKFERFGAMNW